ncbi:MAG: SDR family oxidoreductase [Myxococcales bacterium]|nr:SDR family oxidoreductase [Myxococcales bacterium]
MLPFLSRGGRSSMKSGADIMEAPESLPYKSVMNEPSRTPQRVCVVGASRGSGRAVVNALLARGHQVVALARTAQGAPSDSRLTLLEGDVLDPERVRKAVAGCDAVVVTLGIPENPIAVRFGVRRTPIDVRSRGTANVINAMKESGARRLIVQTTYGIGDSSGRLSLGWAIAFSALLAPQIKDHELQESFVRQSGLEWTLVQPVALVDTPAGRPVLVSTASEAKSMKVSRFEVAEVICGAVDGAFVRQTVAVSS